MVYVVYFRGKPISVYGLEEKEKLQQRIKEMRKEGFNCTVRTASVSELENPDFE